MSHDDLHLDDLIRQALVGRRGIVEKKMFVGARWMRHSNMPCGVGVSCFMLRVGNPPGYAGRAAPAAP